MKAASLCSGYEGFGLGLGFDPVWVCEYEAAPSAVLAARHPDAPNLGDLTAVDWSTVEPVDLLCAGYPCQPFSHAGKREGTNDARHLWPYVAGAVRALRPRLVLLENVAGHLSLGFGDVLGDLAEAGYDAEWCCVRASDVGAPHRRERVFVLAADADSGGRRTGRLAGMGRSLGGRRDDPRDAAAPADTGQDAADTRGAGAGRDARAVPRASAESGRAGADVHAARDARRIAAADAEEHAQRRGPRTGGAGLLSEPRDGRGRVAADADGARLEGRPAVRGGRGERAARADGVVDWGAYAPAIRRWEHLTRPAPAPTDDRGRLNPPFVEWMMGLPAGWVTGLGLPRTAELKMLGSGIVPQQVAAAWRQLAANVERKAA